MVFWIAQSRSEISCSLPRARVGMTSVAVLSSAFVIHSWSRGSILFTMSCSFILKILRKKIPKRNRLRICHLHKHERNGRSSDFRINLLAAPSRSVWWPISGSCGFRPRTQRRVRAGISPVSLLGPKGHHHVT